jgi:hypothetical protein
MRATARASTAGPFVFRITLNVTFLFFAAAPVARSSRQTAQGHFG